MKVFKALTIAGSDSGGGAGIQADLKTFTVLKVYGMSVLTAVTAQNTVGVSGIQEIDADMVARQLDAVLQDIGTHAAKTGMLASSAIVTVVAERLRAYRVHRLVVDPVMVSKSGHCLLNEDAVSTLITALLPLADVVTPNVPEAELITGTAIRTVEDMERAALAIHRMGPRHVVVKGGHLSGRAVDVFYDGRRFVRMDSPRIRTKNTHGTGCTFSAAITANLAMGRKELNAVRAARTYVLRAIERSFRLGKGHGPLNHFHPFVKS
jgi:hydroxymethylpyrimidine/phosphomethylpyrimidine kinase